MLFWYFDSKIASNQEQILSMSNSASAPTTSVVDESGETAYQTPQIRGSEKIFLKIDPGNDRALKELQDQVKILKNKLGESGSVTRFQEELVINKEVKLTPIRDNKGINARYEDEWVKTSTNVMLDGSNSNSDINIRNKYNVELIKDNGEYVARIKNMNPYSQGVDSIKTFVKVKPEKKIGVGVGVGYDPITGSIKPEIQLQYRVLDLF